MEHYAAEQKNKEALEELIQNDFQKMLNDESNMQKVCILCKKE